MRRLSFFSFFSLIVFLSIVVIALDSVFRALTATNNMRQLMRHSSAPDTRGALEPWFVRSSSFVNVFFVWTTHRDTWGSVQDRVLGSVVTNIPGARVRVLTNTLPLFHFDALFSEGFDVKIVRYDVDELLAGLPGSRWANAAKNAAGPFQATHESDLVRLLALTKYGGLYLDTDALWLRNINSLPVAFVGAIDFLRLAPSCTWCIRERWYLANGVLSFPAGHRFLHFLLARIDSLTYEPANRTAIGPQFLTEAYQDAVEASSDVIVLDEALLYPIAGPDVPMALTTSLTAPEEARSLFAKSYSVHIFSHTFAERAIDSGSVFGILLHSVWPPQRGAFCGCSVDVASPLCIPASVIIARPDRPNSWSSPFARVCVKLNSLFLGVAREATLVIHARKGYLRTWTMAPSKDAKLLLYPPYWTSDDLASLEYRHAGHYCGDSLNITLFWSLSNTAWGTSNTALQYSVIVSVSAPCIDGRSLASNTAGHIWWDDVLGSPVPSVTMSELEADPTRLLTFTRCLWSGSKLLLLERAAASGRSITSPLRVGLVVSATGTYVSWLDGLILSAETFFMRKAEVHYFILTDRKTLPFGPVDRMHLLHQPLLGWPYDSMFRHQLYLKSRLSFSRMDFVLVLDADVAFVADVGEEILGETVGVMQSYFFGRTASFSPFERIGKSAAVVSFADGANACYYAGGVFGGSPSGFARLLQRTTLLMEWDMAMNMTAEHDDESYLNKAFFLFPPNVSLGGNYIFPEPPADRAWDLKNVSWSAAFKPRIHNLGARKALSYFDGSPRSEIARTPVEELVSLAASGPQLPSSTPAAVGVCAALPSGLRAKTAWIRDFVRSVDRWHSPFAEIVVVDVSSDATLFFGNPSRSKYVPLRTNRTTGCSRFALRRLLREVHSENVLLIDAPAVLSWQAHVPFLSAQLTSSNFPIAVVAACAYANSATTLFSPGNNPSSPCAALDAAALARELSTPPIVELFTAMRWLACWRVPVLAGYRLFVLSTQLARTLSAEDVGASCDSIACTLDAGLISYSYKMSHNTAALPLISCLHGMTPLISIN